ncbi:MAG: galactosyltransferase-related protein [Casimicrobiaceae bacterium]
MTAAFTARDPADYAQRLAIVVPYRDRADHLARFLPHITAYFERDKLDCAIRYSVHIVEQLGTATFNRGAVKNAGFLLTRAGADYVCFHDVDYLPLWADYSFARRPTRLIWHGLDPEPDRAAFLGGVVAFNLADFARINGYSNDYWEWGYEDDDLRERCRRAGLEMEFRDGTYSALPHAHHGLTPDGSPTAAAQASARTFTAKLLQGAAGFGSEGISTLRFRVVATLQMQRNGIAQPHLLHHQIELL